MPHLPKDKQVLLQRLGEEAHVWYARPDDITDPDQLADYAALLSVDEQERHRRFRFARDRHMFLVSHALVRRVLSLYLDVGPSAWQFSCNQHGRPEIAGPVTTPSLRFNLTHTAGLAACIVTLDTDCGIDVEKIAARGNQLAIAEKMFAASELQALKKLEGAARLDRFILYWTLREAYGKALGVGLAQSGKNYSFDPGTGEQASIQFEAGADDHSSQWQLSVIRPDCGHIIAVALRTGPSPGKAVQAEYIVP